MMYRYECGCVLKSGTHTHPWYFLRVKICSIPSGIQPYHYKNPLTTEVLRHDDNRKNDAKRVPMTDLEKAIYDL